jgi:polysaccharide export outer membrane protein
MTRSPIKPIPLWREGESIEIIGEVNFPGTYSIKLGETLFDVIQRAGGLTDRAFADGALFSRENLRIKEDEQRERLIKQLESDLATATLSATDSEEAAQAQSAARAMLSRLQNTESQGRLVIDLNKILKDAERSDLLVKDQDSLFIPSIPYAVSVSGEVQFPTSHLYNEKLDMNDYLNRSGGYTQNADKDRTFVVKANGAVMTNGAKRLVWQRFQWKQNFSGGCHCGSD